MLSLIRSWALSRSGQSLNLKIYFEKNISLKHLIIIHILIITHLLIITYILIIKKHRDKNIEIKT